MITLHKHKTIYMSDTNENKTPLIPKEDSSGMKKRKFFCPTIGGIHFILPDDISVEELKSLEQAVLRNASKKNTPKRKDG